MSSFWCADGLVVPTCSICMFDVLLLMIASGCWSYVSLIMAALDFSLISLVDRVYVGYFFAGSLLVMLL